MSQIKTQIEDTTSDYDKEKLQERLAKLSGGVAVVKVGAATETEMKEKKHRVEDALQATRAALEEGLVPGGGVALLNAQDAIKGNVGLNADTGEMEDLIKAGVIDPAMVTRSALENAASIGKNILTTEAIVAEPPEKDGGMPGGGMPDMGGMM